MGAYAKGNAVAVRGQEWADSQDPATRRGATIGWYRRFRESDGGLFVVLLSGYLFVTAIPAAPARTQSAALPALMPPRA